MQARRNEDRQPATLERQEPGVQASAASRVVTKSVAT
jgi:hypothetical protein